jgi:hypothetical protein
MQADGVEAPAVATVSATRLAPADVLAQMPVVEFVPHEGITAEAEVRRALQNYRAAYERLDVAAARMVWPSVDHVALTHAFRQLARQRVTFQSCGISVSGASALARCRGQAEYVPKVGPQRALMASGEWVFDLAKSDADWKIVSASVR